MQAGLGGMVTVIWLLQTFQLLDIQFERLHFHFVPVDRDLIQSFHIYLHLKHGCELCRRWLGSRKQVEFGDAHL
jgi:hypothetical protein